MTFSQRMKSARDSKGLTLKELADKVGKTEATVQRYESGEIKNLKNDTIEAIAHALDVSPAYLMGWSEEHSEQPYYTLNDKDEKDIAKTLEKMIENLDGLRYSKEESEYSDETRELLIGALEQAARIAKMEAKRKYTPKKYRNEE